MARSRISLAVMAASAPVIFTGAWWVIGVLDGEDASRVTISHLAAQAAPRGGWMVAALLAQGCGQVANAALARRVGGGRGLPLALLAAGIGTLGAGLLRVPAPDVADESSATGHAVAATVAFVGLHVATLVGALSPRLPRWLRGSAVVALVVALPNLGWFLLRPNGSDVWAGGSERTFVTVLVAWTVALACWCGRPNDAPQ